MLVALIALIVATKGHNELCRLVLTVIAVVLSPSQVYLFATFDGFRNDARLQLGMFQVFFLAYLSIVHVSAWKPGNQSKVATE